MTFTTLYGILILSAAAGVPLYIANSRLVARFMRKRGVNRVSPFDFNRAELERSVSNHPAGKGRA